MLILAMGSLIVFLVMIHLIIGRTCQESRSVLLPLPIDRAWESIRDFGALHQAHGRGRPLVDIESSTLIRGDGLEPGSIWRQQGTWDGGRFFSEIEVVECEAPQRLVVSLHRDSFGTQRGLTRHRLILDLTPFDDRSTRLRLRMTARLNNLPLVLGRTLSPDRMQARLLDLGLRSVKLALDGTGVAVEPAAAPMPLPGLAPISASLAARIATPHVEVAGDTAVARHLPGMLPVWIKPEVAAAALYGLRPGAADAWAASTEGSLDPS